MEVTAIVPDSGLEQFQTTRGRREASIAAKVTEGRERTVASFVELAGRRSESGSISASRAALEHPAYHTLLAPSP